MSGPAYTNTVRIGYARVSARTQDHQLQLVAHARSTHTHGATAPARSTDHRRPHPPPPPSAHRPPTPHPPLHRRRSPPPPPPPPHDSPPHAHPHPPSPPHSPALPD